MINYYLIEIKGKNVKNLLNRIIKEKINIIEIKYYKDSIRLKVSYEDYKKIIKIKTTYKITIIKTAGKKSLYNNIKKYKTPIITFALGVIFIIFLSNLTLNIEIETNNESLKSQIEKSLKENNITLFTFKKNYKTLSKITKNIKKTSQNIEWIEIETKGVKTKVKVIERVKKEEKEQKDYKDIVASKNGYIRKINSRNGQVMKNIDDYVKKDEIIISGNIFRNDKPVAKTKANGKVYAEVWYIVKASHDVKTTKLVKEEKGLSKLTLKIQNKKIDLMKIKKDIETPKSKVLYQGKLFTLYKDKENIYKKEKTVYKDDVLKKILELKAKNKILETLKKDEYIISQKTLKKYKENGKMYIEVFFKVYEDIAVEKDIQEITEEKEE